MSRVRNHPNRWTARKTRVSLSAAMRRPSLFFMSNLSFIWFRPIATCPLFDTVCHRGRTGTRTGCPAATGHRSLVPIWTTGRSLGASGRHPVPQEYRRPTPSSARSAGTSTRGKPGCPASLDAAPASVSALHDASRFPAPSAWGAGLRPPLQHRHPWGCLWLDAGLRPVGHCFAAPPGIRLPGWPGVRSWAAAERLAPRVRLRSHAAPGHRSDDLTANRPVAGSCRMPAASPGRGLTAARPPLTPCATYTWSDAPSSPVVAVVCNLSQVMRVWPTARPRVKRHPVPLGCGFVFTVDQTRITRR